MLKKKLKVPHIGFNSVLRPINSKLYCATKKEIDINYKNNESLSIFKRKEIIEFLLEKHICEKSDIFSLITEALFLITLIIIDTLITKVIVIFIQILNLNI